MENLEKIEFNKERDFSETLGAAFTFVRQNFKVLISAILFLAGPLLLLSAILTSIYVQNMFNFASLGTVDNFDMLSSVFSPVYFLVIIISIVASILIIGITYESLVMYEKNGHKALSVAGIWQAVLKDAGMLFSTFFYLMGILIVFGFAMALVVLIFSAIGVVGVSIFMFLFFIAMLIFGPPLMFLISAIYPIRIRERIGNNAAFKKAYQLMRANFWNTWIVIFVSYLIVSLLALIFSLPQSMYAGAMQLSSVYDGTYGEGSTIFFTILNIISIVGSSIINALLFIIIGFHYFSTNEKVFGVGWSEKIDSIGTHTDDNEDITI